MSTYSIRSVLVLAERSWVIAWADEMNYEQRQELGAQCGNEDRAMRAQLAKRAHEIPRADLASKRSTYSSGLLPVDGHDAAGGSFSACSL